MVSDQGPMCIKNLQIKQAGKTPPPACQDPVAKLASLSWGSQSDSAGGGS